VNFTIDHRDVPQVGAPVWAGVTLDFAAPEITFEIFSEQVRVDNGNVPQTLHLLIFNHIFARTRDNATHQH
jgi:hypothetical protein